MISILNGYSTYFPNHSSGNTNNISGPQPDSHASSTTTDKFTLSEEAVNRARNDDPEAWRNVPREYPRGFPEEAKAQLEQYAKDPSISAREYGLLEFELVALPQIEAHARGYGQSSFSMDTDVFTSSQFNFKDHVRSLIQRNEDIISKGDDVQLRSRQIELLRDFL